MQIRFEWLKYYQESANFVTYYGDIYPGYIYEFNEFPDSIFIIPPINTKTVVELQKANQLTIEKLSEYGWEIRDEKIIQQIIENKGLGNDTDLPNPSILGNQKWRQMFVFGAGASANCVLEEEKRFKKYELRPPLGNELFDERFKGIYGKYEGVRQLLPNLRMAKNEVEKFLQSEWDIIRHTYNQTLLSRHINIYYYFQELFFNISHGVLGEFYDYNLYSSFADKLQKKSSQNPLEKVGIVNFNYDIILDEYLSSHFGVKFKEMDDYINFNKEAFLYFKPHGSANWGWNFSSPESRIEINNAPTWLYNNKTSLAEIYYQHLGTIGDMVHSKSWAFDNKYSVNKNRIEIITDYPRRYLPSLLIPYNEKDEFVMPYHHRLRMEYFMGEMEDLFLIGWKGNEYAFNKLLRTNLRSLKRLIIVNPNQKEVIDNLTPFLGDIFKKYQVIQIKTFEELLNSNLI